MTGSARQPLWNVVADAPADSGVVGVTISYRLNIFGFLAIEELSREQGGTSGNFGLKDQQVALAWVRDNIAAFGGDPERVTVIGQSSGGTSIFALMSAPSSRGLFQRGRSSCERQGLLTHYPQGLMLSLPCLYAAISLSGSPNITMGMAEIETQNRPIVAGAECNVSVDPTERLACLRLADAKTLLAAIPSSWNTPGESATCSGRGGPLDNW
jgi:hypothetical protein